MFQYVQEAHLQYISSAMIGFFQVFECMRKRSTQAKESQVVPLEFLNSRSEYIIFAEVVQRTTAILYIYNILSYFLLWSGVFLLSSFPPFCFENCKQI